MLKSYFTIVGLEKPARDDFVALKLFLTAYVLDRLGRFTHAIEVRLVHVLKILLKCKLCIGGYLSRVHFDVS